MRRPAALPRSLPEAFTVARARAAGVTPDRLRASDLWMPFHGTRARTPLDVFDRLGLLLRTLPEHAFVCGTTAALCWGLPLPLHERRRATELLQIGVPQSHTRIRRPGIRGRRLHVVDDDVIVLSGMRVLAPPRMWIDVSDRLALEDLVALTDHALAWRRPMISAEELALAARRFAGSRGSAKRRTALLYCDDRAESPPESIVRVLFLEAGLPRPECNVEIHDGRRFVARVDMLFRDAKLIVEYDGDHHRDPHQWSRDQSRRAELESLGYRVTVVTRRDLDEPAQLIARIRRLLAA